MISNFFPGITIRRCLPAIDKVPVPSGSGVSSDIDKVFPTVAVPVIGKLASPLSKFGKVWVPEVTESRAFNCAVVGVSKIVRFGVLAITFVEAVIKAASSEVDPLILIALVTVTTVVALPIVLRLLHADVATDQ